jgi:hypothetical protein
MSPSTTVFGPDAIEFGWSEFRREIDRSRRYEHPLAMLGLPVTPDLNPDATWQQLTASVRTIDVVWTDGSWFYVVMPETTRERAVVALQRIRSQVPALRDEWRMAVFPDDALTAEALLQSLARSAPQIIGAAQEAVGQLQ